MVHGGSSTRAMNSSCFTSSLRTAPVALKCEAAWANLEALGFSTMANACVSTACTKTISDSLGKGPGSDKFCFLQRSAVLSLRLVYAASNELLVHECFDDVVQVGIQVLVWTGDRVSQICPRQLLTVTTVPACPRAVPSNYCNCFSSCLVLRALEKHLCRIFCCLGCS